MTKLIFCFDGTSNDPEDSGDFANDGSVSNILKMHALFGGSLKNRGEENPEASGQRSFYYSGIGTYGGWIRRAINATIAPTYWDMDKIIENAAKDLKDAFQDGDEIHIFGFSRGAAIARMFAAEIKEHCSEVKAVKFLGVFDTVAAIKGSRDLDENTYPASEVLFEDGTMSKYVEKAVHLVALDEKRVMFQPTLFNKDDRIEEVWFAGVHSDIGGGYWFDGLSDIALKFMLKKCKEVGLHQLPTEEVNYDGFFLTEGDEKMSEEERLCPDDLEIHPTPKGTLHAQQRSKKIAEVTLASRKLRVMKGDEVSDDVPIVHHTVLERFREVASYRPVALRNVKYQVMGTDGECEEKPRHGIADMRT